jgi:uncharacterized membrane protein
MSMNKLVKTAINTVFILTTASFSASAIADHSATSAPDGMEKCYGIAKAGMNDCGTAAQSCAGEVKQDKQADAYLFLPKGLCEKIAGSSLKASNSSKK